MRQSEAIYLYFHKPWKVIFVVAVVNSRPVDSNPKISGKLRQITSQNVLYLFGQQFNTLCKKKKSGRRS